MNNTLPDISDVPDRIRILANGLESAIDEGEIEKIRTIANTLDELCGLLFEVAGA